MTVTAATFRQNFPEFVSDVTYPDTLVEFWLAVAVKQVRAQVWQDQTDLGVQLFTAHQIVLEAAAKKASLTGGTPGQNTGPVNNKSVDKVSIGFDTGASSVEKGGNWNLTTYGTRFKYFVDLFGAGGIQL